MLGWCPVFEPKISASFDGDGAALVHEAALLDEIAEESGLPLLSSFSDQREPPADFDGYPEELSEALGPWQEWFSVEEGLRCVHGLLTCLEEEPARARLRSSPEVVVDDLSALCEVLLVAVKRKNVRFRLELA
jgi:hypothetical protein